MKWRRFFIVGLGVLYLLVLTSPLSVVKAKNLTTPDFIWPYSGIPGRDFYITQGCHADGWGKFVGGIPSTCAIDFTHYSGGEKINCGYPAMAPVSGEFTNIGNDGYGNTAGILKGVRYLVFMLHGDFVPSGHLNQGDIIGYENTHGLSSACHWHITVFDTSANQWVNPLNLQPVGSKGAITTTLDISKIQVAAPQINFELLPVSEGFRTIQLTPSVSAVESGTPPSQSSQDPQPDLLLLAILFGAIFFLTKVLRPNSK